jgi:5-formyltetrahydrofolate cyclo-ligase
MGERRRALSPDDRRIAGAAVGRIVVALDVFERAERVAAYVALDDEVPTDMILDAVIGSGRVLLLPRVVGPGLEFAAVGDLGQLRRGRWRAFEPSNACVASQLAPGDLVLVPGVAFDRRGGRLGRGGGHYDRAFAASGVGPLRVGLAFSFQIVPSVPTDDRDRFVDGVVTELGFAVASPPSRDPMPESS